MPAGSYDCDFVGFSCNTTTYKMYVWSEGDSFTASVGYIPMFSDCDPSNSFTRIHFKHCRHFTDIITAFDYESVHFGGWTYLTGSFPVPCDSYFAYNVVCNNIFGACTLGLFEVTVCE